MNKFIKKTSLFLLISSVAIAIFIITIHYLVDFCSNFEINKDINSIVLGNSHSECAFNDSEISNLKNLSASGETYFYTFQKVKKILPKNKHIKYIFIEYTNIQIDSEMNSWTWGYDQMSGKFPLYSPFMNTNDIKLLFKNNPEDFLSVLSKSTRENLLNVLRIDYSLSTKYGGFLPLKVSKIDSLLLNPKHKKVSMQKEKHSISNVNLQYLRKIVDYCNDNNVSLYLVRSPQHKNTSYLKNEKLFLELKKSNFPELEFLDFNDFPLKNEEFADFGHLNKKGANKFSVWFNTLLESGILSMVNKQEFINQNIDILTVQK